MADHQSEEILFDINIIVELRNRKTYLYTPSHPELCGRLLTAAATEIVEVKVK